MAKKRPGNSQGLSRTALAAKRARDLAAANTPVREQKRAENQRKGQSDKFDWHHTASGQVRRATIAYNRATYDRGEVA
jgi:hypothetical protein